MMKQQSVDFIVGYAFHALDKQFVTHLTNNPKDVNKVFNVSIPKLWWGTPNPCNPRTTVDTVMLIEFAEKLVATLRSAHDKFEFNIDCIHEHQYLRVAVTVDYKRVEMTLAEIEQKLGYKIKLVEDKYEETTRTRNNQK